MKTQYVGIPRCNPHLGGDFEDFLKECGTLAESGALAIKRIVAIRLNEILADGRYSKSRLAETIHISRTSLDRLLDPDNTSVTLVTLNKAARATGMRLRLESSL